MAATHGVAPHCTAVCRFKYPRYTGKTTQSQSRAFDPKCSSSSSSSGRHQYHTHSQPAAIPPLKGPRCYRALAVNAGSKFWDSNCPCSPTSHNTNAQPRNVNHGMLPQHQHSCWGSCRRCLQHLTTATALHTTASCSSSQCRCRSTQTNRTSHQLLQEREHPSPAERIAEQSSAPQISQPNALHGTATARHTQDATHTPCMQVMPATNNGRHHRSYTQ